MMHCGFACFPCEPTYYWELSHATRALEFQGGGYERSFGSHEHEKKVLRKIAMREMLFLYVHRDRNDDKTLYAPHM